MHCDITPGSAYTGGDHAFQETCMLSEKLFQIRKLRCVVWKWATVTDKLSGTGSVWNRTLSFFSLSCELCRCNIGFLTLYHTVFFNMASEAVWSVDQLISSQEDSSLSFDKKLELKRLGRPMPTFKIKETPNCRLSMHYEKKQWLTGCAKRQAFFCFPCLLFKFKTTVFSEPTRGISKMKNFSNRTNKHEGTKAHIAAAVAFELLGKPIIQLFICYNEIMKNCIQAWKSSKIAPECTFYRIIFKIFLGEHAPRPP